MTDPLVRVRIPVALVARIGLDAGSHYGFGDSQGDGRKWDSRNTYGFTYYRLLIGDKGAKRQEDRESKERDNNRDKGRTFLPFPYNVQMDCFWLFVHCLHDASYCFSLNIAPSLTKMIV